MMLWTDSDSVSYVAVRDLARRLTPADGMLLPHLLMHLVLKAGGVECEDTAHGNCERT